MEQYEPFELAQTVRRLIENGNVYSSSKIKKSKLCYDHCCTLLLAPGFLISVMAIATLWAPSVQKWSLYENFFFMPIRLLIYIFLALGIFKPSN